MRAALPRTGWLQPVLLVLAVLVSAALYLGTANRTFRLGLPLDDSWIHQTYSRNLAERGEWAFIPGRPSAGSTAPLWSVALAIGYILRIPPLAWTYAIGLLVMLAVVWLVFRWVKLRAPRQSNWAWTVGLLTAFEWHLIWAGLSGMETLALAALALLIFYGQESGRWGPGRFGLLIGLGAWLRPDALTLVLAPAAKLLLGSRRNLAVGLLRLTGGLMTGLLPYLAWQYSLAGSLLPNTFFAKQAEYAALREIPLAVRLVAQTGLPAAWFGVETLEPGGPLVGVMAALAPGLLLSTIEHLRRRNWERLLPLMWSGVYVGAYALRLPATYQHGRYALPVLPVWMVLASAGMLGGLRPRSDQFGSRVFARAWIALVPIIAGYFWLAGAVAYGQDVAIVESEMVDSARWVAGHTPPGAVVAAHDIGALGYFGQRPLIDLAGLIDSSVVPILRDEPALALYVSERGADYLMTFPGWYPQLTAGKVPVYVTGGQFSPAAGSENMAVYRWESSSFAPCGGCAILAKLWQGRP